ncbi:putative aspartokinase [[Clostridium] ultunense Esp]|uniref:aspartate kinase n=1 Tax=Thermicanus aegyptius TaxID=94009 RepID=UPI0002B70816|nr:aspartate kinase [Thermicanus aegyptius]CCQ96510.1 putative aspartokinase [[Clostridium] ultunense Esp]
MKVAKFGGTSLASAEQIQKVGAIIRADASRRIIVVSAPGKRFKEDVKVTDLLIAYGQGILQRGTAEAEKEAVLSRFQQIMEGLGFPNHQKEEILGDLNKALRSAPKDRPERFLDAIKAVGEDTNARIVAHYLRLLGEEAFYVNPWDAGFYLTDEAGNAQILPESYDRLRSLKERKGILVFPGFFGYTPEGVLVTFSRGGSDITGSILAAAVQAELYENFTDVDAIYTVNPRIIPNPREIQEITYREMRELSYAGFSVFHEEALLPAYRAGIPVCVKNTNNPSAPGTMIVSERTLNGNPVTGIASEQNFCSVFVSKYLLHREIGFGRRLLQIFEEEGLSYEHTPSGIDNISVIIREQALDRAKEERIVERIYKELNADHVSIERDLALIMIVGEGMRENIGIAARATSALAKAKVNLEMINQGSSEVSMMFGVKAADAERAVIALYHEFYGD